MRAFLAGLVVAASVAAPASAQNAKRAYAPAPTPDFSFDAAPKTAKAAPKGRAKSAAETERAARLEEGRKAFFNQKYDNDTDGAPGFANDGQHSKGLGSNMKF